MTELLDRIGAAFLRILGMFKRPELSTPVFEEIDQPPDPQSRPLDEKKNFSENLGELLDHLDEAFTAYRIPTDMMLGYVNRDELLGLKKLGAHIPNPWQMLSVPYGEEVIVNVRNKQFPAMMFIGLVLGHYDIKDRSHPDFMYAVKQKKLPWYVEHKEGTPYKFGFGYRFHGAEKHKRMWWMGAWLVITPRGTIEFCKETRVKDVIIRSGRNAGMHYAQRVRCYSELYESTREEHNEKGIHDLKNFFRSMYVWWTDRNSRWSVSVKKDGDRVTFAVDRALTKKYFADRNKVVDDKGRTKRIIHYVKGHERIRDNKKYYVKEHLRGLSKFNWKGYQCTVVAPEFNELPTVMFDGAALELNEKDEMPGHLAYLQTSKAGLLLAQAEDGRAR